jgi:hypothetical protein
MSKTTRKGGGRPTSGSESSHFTPTTFEGLLKDLQSGRVPLKHVTVTDDVQAGLRAKIRKTGGITFHVSYNAPDEDDEDSAARPFLLVGRHPETSVAKARARAETVRQLAELGIDPKKGLHDRLLRELDEKGTKWRP